MVRAATSLDANLRRLRFPCASPGTRIEQRVANYEQICAPPAGCSTPPTVSRDNFSLRGFPHPGRRVLGPASLHVAPAGPAGEGKAAPILPSPRGPDSADNLPALGYNLLTTRPAGPPCCWPGIPARSPSPPGHLLTDQPDGPAAVVIYLACTTQPPVDSPAARQAALPRLGFTPSRIRDLMASLYGEGIPGGGDPHPRRRRCHPRQPPLQLPPGCRPASAAAFSTTEYISFPSTAGRCRSAPRPPSRAPQPPSPATSSRWPGGVACSPAARACSPATAGRAPRPPRPGHDPRTARESESGCATWPSTTHPAAPTRPCSPTACAAPRPCPRDPRQPHADVGRSSTHLASMTPAATPWATSLLVAAWFGCATACAGIRHPGAHQRRQFVVLLPHIDDRTDAEPVAGRIPRRLASFRHRWPRALHLRLHRHRHLPRASAPTT